MTSKTSLSSANSPRAPRNKALVVLDVAAGVVLITLGIVLGIAVFVTAVAYGSLHAQCGAGPYEGLTCNTVVLSIAVYGLMAVAVFAFFLGVGMFLVHMVRKRYGFHWPLITMVATVALFYLGTWIVSLTVPLAQ